jgi:hypothetical protein
MLRTRDPRSPGWYRDPTRRHQFREWDGERWTEHVSDDGQPGIDPVRSNAVEEITRSRSGRRWIHVSH